jgi:hypothetical protein
LLNLELVRLALDDVSWCARPVDVTWQHAGLLPRPMTGFNPATGAVYHAASSATAAWLAAPGQNVRRLNEKDRLLREVLFGVHDYLHILAYRLIRARRPEFGTQPITAASFESQVFLHLLTEAVATVGLDYWFLSTFDLDRRLRIGSNVRSLTVRYHVDDEPEYQLFAPDFTAQEPGFLRWLCEFYCTGEWAGFDLDDARHSPRIMAWLEHEISYGDLQRTYTRQWLSYLAHDEVRVPLAALGSSVACDAPWQQALMDEVGQALWDLVKQGIRPSAPASTDPWASPLSRAPDFRFVNIAAVDLEAVAAEIAAGRHTQENALFCFDQWMAGFDYHAFDPDLRELVPELRRKTDVKLALRLFREQKRVAGDPGPRDLFFFT